METLYVLVLFGGYLALWSIKRYRQRRDTGIDPEVFGEADDRLQRYFARITKVLTGVVVILISAHAIGVEERWGFHHLAVIDVRWANHLGLGVGVIGLVLCHIAQVTMGASWRVGIDEQHETLLVTTGIFRYIRNPTYLGLYLVNTGLWLIWPTAAIAMFVLIFGLFIEVQVRCEEQHLLTAHGEAYRRYLTRTKRYIPGLY